MPGQIQNSTNNTVEIDWVKHLTFYIDHQLFAIPTKDVIEIIKVQESTFMPKLPNFVKGVINIRGSIIPLIDLRLRFGKPEKEYTDKTCIVVVETGEIVVGLIVDRVRDVIDIQKDLISRPPTITKESINSFIQGISKLDSEVVLILDSEKVIVEEND